MRLMRDGELNAHAGATPLEERYRTTPDSVVVLPSCSEMVRLPSRPALRLVLRRLEDSPSTRSLFAVMTSSSIELGSDAKHFCQQYKAVVSSSRLAIGLCRYVLGLPAR